MLDPGRTHYVRPQQGIMVLVYSAAFHGLVGVYLACLVKRGAKVHFIACDEHSQADEHTNESGSLGWPAAKRRRAHQPPSLSPSPSPREP